MAKSADELRSIIDAAWADINSGNWLGWSEIFAERCTFVNSRSTQPFEGRAELVKLAGTLPILTNQRQWTAVDGNRVVTGWWERKGEKRGDAPWYYGISSFLFDDDGKVVEYIGVFDPQAAQESDDHGGWSAQHRQTMSALEDAFAEAGQ